MTWTDSLTPLFDYYIKPYISRFADINVPALGHHAYADNDRSAQEI